MKNKSTYPWGPPDICPHGIILPVLDERLWNPRTRAVIYFLALLYFFLGINVLTDAFITTVEYITNTTRQVHATNKKSGKRRSVREYVMEEVFVWNRTVASLTIVALGIGAPEILLPIISTVTHNFEVSTMGTGMVVGSAVYRLLINMSVCMLTLEAKEIKRLVHFRVLTVIVLIGFFTYIWLLMVLRVISPGVVHLWEASITISLYPILVLGVYAAEKRLCRHLFKPGPSYGKRKVDIRKGNQIGTRGFFTEGRLNKNRLIGFMREAKKCPGVSDEDAAALAAAALLKAQPHSAAWYRISATRRMTGGRRVEPVLNPELQNIYNSIIHVGTLEEAPSSEIPLRSKSIAEHGRLGKYDDYAIIEFHAAAVTVKENIGPFPVTICRRGNLAPRVRVRVRTIDGTAARERDYVPIDEIITFQPNQRETEVMVEIMGDSHWEPNEEFFIQLTLPHREIDNARLGEPSVMEVKILDDDNPGIIAFEKRRMWVKSSVGSARIPVVRYKGSSLEVSVMYKTIDNTAMSGKNYVGSTGTIEFKNMESRVELVIPIINEFTSEKGDSFDVELFEPTNGARVGIIKRVTVTITSDDDIYTSLNRLIFLTKIKIDAVEVSKDSWAEQIRTAMSVNGGDLGSATCADYVLHFFCFFWKVLFAFLPPPHIFKGWFCFFIALICIAVMVTIISDLAAIFGCLVGIQDITNAITIVTIGNAMPDTIATWMVTKFEEHADGPLMHITSSIAVNVPLGVGIPCFVAALYHEMKDSVSKAPAGPIGFNVAMFTVGAILVSALLVLRRNLAVCGRAELGGPRPTRYLTVFILVFLWILYIVLTALEANGHINPHF